MRLTPATWPWLLRHEIRLAWRNVGGMRLWFLLVFGGLLWAAMHLAAWGLLVGAQMAKFPPNIVVIFGLVVWLIITLMLSQAIMLSVSALFDRGDFDLLLASPMSARTVFIVRGIGIAVSVITLYFLLVSPFAHVGLLTGQYRLLAIYPALLSIGLFVTAIGMLFTLTLVRLLGARRARVTAQLLGALVGAILFLLSQMQTMFGGDTRTRILSVFKQAMEPGGMLAPDSALWFPFRALTGELVPLLITVMVGAGTFAAVMALTYRRFLSGTQESVTGSAVRRNVALTANETKRYFRSSLLRNVLFKEWRLILRDPQLISQTALQMLYLLPLIFLAMRGDHRLIYLVPGAVLLAATLTGSLAWITVAAEDAPELVGSAPVKAQRVRMMKALAAMIPVWIFVAPMLLFLLWHRPAHALVFVVCTLGATASAGVMQVWYPRKANRKEMKKRGQSEVLINLLEGFCAFAWSGVAWALVIDWPWRWFAALFALLVALVAPVLVWQLGRSRRQQGLLAT